MRAKKSSRKGRATSSQERRARLERHRLALRETDRQIKRLVAADNLTIEERRRLEALRRNRLSVQLRIEKESKAKRVVQGPKGGVRTIVQGGSPGLGKRA